MHNSIGVNEIKSWLKNKKNEVGKEGVATIDNILMSIKENEIYSEGYRKEKFIIVPMVNSARFNKHAAKEAKAVLEFLLLTTNEEGAIRRGDIVLFSTKTTNLSKLPLNSFQNFFENQLMDIDGTFTMVSMTDIKQYEMDFENGKPAKFKLWEGRAPKQAHNESNYVIEEEPYCIDWYLVTTIYYSNGAVEVFEEYLYTQCYGGSGGGSNPTPQNLQYIQRQVSFLVASKSTSYENWEMHADYDLSGMRDPANSASNYFLTPPAPLDPSGASTSHMVWGYGFQHTTSWHPWFIQFNMISNSVGLNNANKTGFANFTGQLIFPNQNGRVEIWQNQRQWQAAIELQ